MMKGWMKWMLIAAAVCVGIGTVMCISALAMGGRFSYYLSRSFGIVDRRDLMEMTSVIAEGENQKLFQNFIQHKLWEKKEYDKAEKTMIEIRIPTGTEFDKMDLELKGEFLNADQVTAGKLELGLSAGNLEVTDDIVQHPEGQCIGELTYEDQIIQKMEAEYKTGRILYEINGMEEDFNCELESLASIIVVNGVEKGKISGNM